MGFMDMIRNGVRNFLRLEPAQPSAIVITEAMTFEDNAAKNQIWYRGDSYELEQLYHQIHSSKHSFWGAHSTRGQEIRKIHTGVPGLIVDRLADIVLYDMNDFDFATVAQESTWKEIDKENDFKKQLQEALKDTLVVGDGAFRISFDTAISQLPILEWVSGERIEIVYQRGRLKEVIFRTRFTERRKSYLLEETYGFGYIKYKLFTGESELGLQATEYTKNLTELTFDSSVILCVPFSVFASKKERGRGQSIFDRKADTFDSLDEAWSQWMDALRSGRSKEYIPENLLPRDPETGMVMKPNAFDNRFIKIGNTLEEDAKNQITLQQPTIPHDSYLVTYVTALDLALQGLVSPSTLGIDVKKLDNAEAQREKEKATLYTRNSIVTALQEFIPRLLDMTLNSYNIWLNKPLEEVVVDVPFGEYANPSFESQVETVSKAKTGGIMSLEASVDELYGDSKDEQWKAEEVARLKAEQGITEAVEPKLNTELDGFEVTVDEDSNDTEQSVSDEQRGSDKVVSDE